LEEAELIEVAKVLPAGEFVALSSEAGASALMLDAMIQE
jgi:hypothetical protein